MCSQLFLSHQHLHHSCTCIPIQRTRHSKPSHHKRMSGGRSPDRSRVSAPASLPASLLLALPSLPSLCFDAACQAAVDRTFLVVLALPLLVLAAWASFLLRPVPPELKRSGAVFEDEDTGVVFGSPDGQAPERDKDGELAFRVVSYTPWPVEPSYSGDRVRLMVGPVARKQPRTFVFPRVLSQPSELVLATLPRPLGVVLEWDDRHKRAVVAELVEGSNAQQKSKIASLNRELAADAVLPGDVLRAVTCTNFVYPTRALFGAVPPERHIVVYGADQMKFSAICGALRKGDARDGPVTLVLERRAGQQQQP